MNIKNLIRIPRAVNLSKALEGSEHELGTFKEIYNKVNSGVMIPLIQNSGEVVGMLDTSSAHDPVVDAIEKMKFERRFALAPLMQWSEKALELSTNSVNVKEIHEDGNDVYVVTDSGEVITISGSPQYEDEEEEVVAEDTICTHDSVEKNEKGLPSNVLFYLPDAGVDEVTEEECESICYVKEGAIKKELKNIYGHFIARDADLHYDYEDFDFVKITNITWGRKVYNSDKR